MSLWLAVRVMEMSLAIIRFAVDKSRTGEDEYDFRRCGARVRGAKTLKTLHF
jgi:hypothetical protein